MSKYAQTTLHFCCSLNRFKTFCPKETTLYFSVGPQQSTTSPNPESTGGSLQRSSKPFEHFNVCSWETPKITSKFCRKRQVSKRPRDSRLHNNLLRFHFPRPASSQLECCTPSLSSQTCLGGCQTPRCPFHSIRASRLEPMSSNEIWDFNSMNQTTSTAGFVITRIHGYKCFSIQSVSRVLPR